MAGEFKIGGVVVTKQQADEFQKAVISRYTLVPVGLVLGAIVVTASVMMAFGSERERILVLETKVSAIEDDNERWGPKIDRIHDDMLVIKTKLGIAEDPTLGPRGDAQNGSSHERKTNVAIEDNVGRDDAVRRSDARPVGHRSDG